MTWINIIPPEKAEGPLALSYEKIKGPGGAVDNILVAHSLRPATLQGHMALYKSVLHHRDNQLPVWQLEAIGVLVSRINRCDYCVDHHLEGLKRSLPPAHSIDELDQLLIPGAAYDALGEPLAAMLRYAEELTRMPHLISANSIDNLREAGLDDGEILEVNQVSAYFSYANRTVLGLGVKTDGEPLGLAPRDREHEESWQHE